MLLYYITDRKQFPGDETQRRRHLLEKISEAVHAGIDYLQLRERDLSGRELESLAREALRIIRESNSKTRLLINSRTDVALAIQADGVHLRSRDISPSDVRNVWRLSQPDTRPIIAVSCHTAAETAHAHRGGAEFVVFAPVFEKSGVPSSAGLDELRLACQHAIPVLALGGVTLENAHSCIEAGASGIAGIRLFQENEITTVVSVLTEH